MAFLLVREPGRVAFTVDLGAACSFGRDAANDIVVANTQVSRMHLRIVAVDAGHIVRDLDSRHGTFLNGTRITEHVLRDGDRVQLGQVELTYLDREQPERPTIASVTAAGLASSELGTGETRRLQLLHDVAALIVVGGGRIDLANKVLESVVTGLDGEQGVIGLVERSGSLRSVTRGKHELVLPNAILEALLRRRESVLATDGGRQTVGAPLLASSRVLGLLYVARKEPPFSADDRSFLDIVAQLFAAALVQCERESRLERVAQASREPTDELLGEAEPLLALRERVRRCASGGDASVLIRGESGTGKGLVARLLHAQSSRASGPFVAVNCAAIPDTLIESELFGHEKGAFTGAQRAMRGKFALAHGGTIFLDEVGDLSASAQAKLLRAVEEHEVQPLGSEETIEVDVRVLSATHRNLDEEITAGKFRADLYYRLAVVDLLVPPLRTRGNDILLLAETFLRRAARRLGRRIQGFTPAARDVLLRYSWPGNVRQLANEVERALILSDEDMIELDDLRARVDGDSGALVSAVPRTFADAERELMQRALHDSGGNIRAAARTLEISRNTLYRKLRKYNLVQD